MKRKDKHSNQIPVPVGGMSSSHPLKFKLSSKPTAVKKRQFVYNKDIIGSKESSRNEYDRLNSCCDMSKPSKKVINLFKSMPYRDLVKHIKEEEVQALKMLYFKGWLMSRE